MKRTANLCTSGPSSSESSVATHANARSLDAIGSSFMSAVTQWFAATFFTWSRRITKRARLLSLTKSSRAVPTPRSFHASPSLVLPQRKSFARCSKRTSSSSSPVLTSIWSGSCTTGSKWMPTSSSSSAAPSPPAFLLFSGEENSGLAWLPLPPKEKAPADDVLEPHAGLPSFVPDATPAKLFGAAEELVLGNVKAAPALKAGLA